MSESINVENKKQIHQKPPLSRARIAGEILAGTATGVAFAVPVLYVTVYVIVRAIWGEEKNLGLGGFVVLGFILLVFPMVYGPSSAIGVYLVGRRGTQTDSFLATLGWGCLGGLVMLVMLPLVFLLSGVLIVGVEKIVAWSLWALALLIPPIAAAYGFNLGTSGTFTWITHWRDRRKATDESIAAEKKKQDHLKPPRSLGRIAGEILAGTALGLVVLLVVYVTGIVIVGEYEQLATRGFLAVFILVLSPLYGLSSAVGVYLVGTRGKQTGSFLATLGRGFLGVFVMVLLGFCASSAGDMMLGIAKIVLWPLAFLAAPIFATLGFNLTRRYKKPPSPCTQ